MQPALQALMSGASALLSTALGAATWPLGSSRGGARRSPSTRTRRVGPYVLLERIAAGGVGQVYRARHTPTGQVRAVKLLGSAGEKQRLQFEKEIRFGEQLCHPHMVSVQDHGETPDGSLYFAMELVDGVSLEALVEQAGALPPRRVVDILLQVAEVLAEMHEQGFVHRDIKPGNILLCRAPGGGDFAKLLDFGLIKHRDEPSASAANDCVVGTPLYISPEALSAPDAVDGRTDLYGLGAVAYFLLVGAPVFGGRSVVEVCAQHLLTPPEPLLGRVHYPLSNELERVVLECLAKSPAERPASARELMRRLRRCPELLASSVPASPDGKVRVCSEHGKDFSTAPCHVAATTRSEPTPSSLSQGKEP
jgi:eukaryotic-like serine/threonine-protein kinase